MTTDISALVERIDSLIENIHGHGPAVNRMAIAIDARTALVALETERVRLSDALRRCSAMLATLAPRMNNVEIETLIERLTKEADAALGPDATPHFAKERVSVEHVCGLQGYNGMIDPPCPACEASRIALESRTDRKFAPIVPRKKQE